MVSDIITPLLIAPLFTAGAHIVSHYRRWQSGIWIFKPLTTLLIIAWALVIIGKGIGTPWEAVAHGFAQLFENETGFWIRQAIILGLCASLMGDILLMLEEKYFLSGLIAFLVAHVIYIIGFFSLIANLSPELPVAWFWQSPSALLCYLFFTGVILTGWRLFWPRTGELQIPVAVYAAVIALMWLIPLLGVSAMGALESPALHHIAWRKGFYWLLIGATLFMVSDFILAWDRFVKQTEWAEMGLLVTYYAAQFFIATSLVFFLSS